MAPPLVFAEPFQCLRAHVVFVHALSVRKMPKFHRLDDAVYHHRGSQASAQSEKEQLPALVASERLHRSIVDNPDGATECLSKIESDPAATQVMRFCNRMTVQDRSRITDRDHVERPSPRQFAN